MILKGEILAAQDFFDMEKKSATLCAPPFNDSFDHIPGLPGFTMKENAFWDVFIAGFTRSISFAIAFCRFGNVVNTETDLFVFNFKYDF